MKIKNITGSTQNLPSLGDINAAQILDVDNLNYSNLAEAPVRSAIVSGDFVLTELDDTELTQADSLTLWDQGPGAWAIFDSPMPPPLNYNAKYGSVKSGITRPSQTTEGLVNNQDNVLEDYLVLVFTPRRSGTHRIICNYVYSTNSQQEDFIGEIEITGDQGFSEQENITQIEVKDAAGLGPSFDTIVGGVIGPVADISTDQRIRNTFINDYQLVEGEEYTIVFRFGASLLDIAAAVHRAILSCEEKVSE